MALETEVENLRRRLELAERERDAAVVALAASGEQARLAEVLHNSETKFRAVFDTMIEACCVFDMIYDDLGRAVDWKILEANPGYERQSGLKDVAGKLASEVMPGTEAYWLEMFGRVAETGEAEQIEKWHQPTGRWIHSSTARVGGPGSRRLVSVFYDITERKRAEIALRESEERQAFLLKLGDSLRAQPDEDAMAKVAVELIAARMQADRCWIAVPNPHESHARIQYDHRRPDLPSMKDFPETAKQQLTVCLRKGEGRSIWSLTVAHATPRSWTRAEAALLEEGAERTWAAMERARAERTVRESEERFRQFAAASSGGLWIRNATTMAMEYVSPAITAIYGAEPEDLKGEVQTWAAHIVPDDRAIALEHVEKARLGESVVHEFRIQRVSDRSFRWIRDISFPLHDEQGRIQRIGGIATDVTEEKLAVEHQGILLAELQHRVRNIMAMIRSITARTAETVVDVPDYAARVSGRLHALARVQALLTRAANTMVGLRSLVRDEISAQGREDQYVSEGPDVLLSAKAAEILTLAIHELATNALKYGALSVPAGRIHIRWQTAERQGQPWLLLDWTEEGAPKSPAGGPQKPRRQGFGSELIEGRIPYELKGRAQLAIEPGGARCHLEFPLHAGTSVLETGAPRRATVFGGSLDMTGEADLSGYRVLVVEDDYYLASDAARALRGAGAEVVGPCSTEDEASAEIDARPPDAALVDINLGAGPSFRLAEKLKDKAIPFAFVTGYDQEAILAMFDDVERLEKPTPLRRMVGTIAAMLHVADTVGPL